ncbi:MAG: BMP family protein [Chloroflexota bacterium]|jgi:basic membrane lipoprotein Med (substrate-binding protein (PBP1-ABC) superfamily)
MKIFKLVLAMVLLVMLAVQCAPAAPVEEPQTGEDQPPLFFGAFATPVEEPWVGVIHTALQKAADEGKIRYEHTDDIGYAGDMERVLREVSEKQKPVAIFGDAFGNEEAVRRVAKDYPEIAFVFGSGLGPAEPNMSVFDNWIHEPAYLCGLIAGGVTKTNVIGVVGGYPVPEVNRIVNAFINGVKEVNPDAKVIVSFINSWFDPAAAKEAALAQVDAGADVLFAERFGVIEAAVENDLFAFGNMSDQNELAPEHVLTGPVWNMTPTVEYVIAQIEAGLFTAQDLKDFSMVGKGGAYLAPFHGMDSKIPAEILDLVKQRDAEIRDGLFRVDIEEEPPVTQ